MFKKVIVLFLSLVPLCMSSSCDNYPRDPQSTLKKVENRLLRVGVTENPPYVIFKDRELAGLEVEMITAFAENINAEIKWVKGSEETVLMLLKNSEIDIAAGGFNHKSIWKKHVYFIKPHDTIDYRWGVPYGMQVPQNLKGQKVYVKTGSVAGAYVNKEKGQTIYSDSLTGREPLIAAPINDLFKLNFTPSEKSLKKEKIALAIQKGENAFLQKLEYFVGHYEK